MVDLWIARDMELQQIADMKALIACCSSRAAPAQKLNASRDSKNIEQLSIPSGNRRKERTHYQQFGVRLAQNNFGQPITEQFVYTFCLQPSCGTCSWQPLCPVRVHTRPRHNKFEGSKNSLGPSRTPAGKRSPWMRSFASSANDISHGMVFSLYINIISHNAR